MKVFKQGRFTFKASTKEELLQSNPLLLYGELAFEVDTSMMKIGDGKNKYDSLKYLTRGEKGDKGEPFTFNDLTEEQKEELRAKLGDLSEYVTIEQLDTALKELNIDVDLSSYATTQFVEEQLKGKVSVKDGYDLSENDYSDEDKKKVDNFKDTTYDIATTLKDGLLSTGDKKKLDGIAEGANKYVHPSTSGNKHIPSGGTAGQILGYSSSGTAEWINSDEVESIVLYPSSGTPKIAVSKVGKIGFLNIHNASLDDIYNLSSSVIPIGYRPVNIKASASSGAGFSGVAIRSNGTPIAQIRCTSEGDIYRQLINSASNIENLYHFSMSYPIGG